MEPVGSEKTLVSEASERSSIVRMKSFDSMARIGTKTPSKAVLELGGERALQVWSILKNLDLVARLPPEEPSPRTCCCGGLVLVVVLLAYAILAFQKFFDARPSIDITNADAGGDAAAPMPDIGISIGEDYPIEPINKSTLLKHMTPKFTFRTMDMKHSFGKVKTYTLLQPKFDSECNFVGTQTMNQTFLCVLRDSPAYSATEKIRPMDPGTKQRMGNQDVQEQTKTIENLRLAGRYNEDFFAWLEIRWELNTESLSAFREEFMIDSKGNERDLKCNLWFRFDRESWSHREGLHPGDWAWFIYYRIPQYKIGKNNMTGASSFKVDLSANRASVGKMRPFSSSEKSESKKEWFSWEMTWDTDEREVPWQNGLALIDIDIRVGRKERNLHVTYPTAADIFTALGGDYNVALFCGIVWAVLLSYMLRGFTWTFRRNRVNLNELEAKRNLEDYCYDMHAKILKKKWRNILAVDERDKIQKAIQDTLDWLDEHQLADEDELEAKQVEITEIINPILSKVHHSSGKGNGLPASGEPNAEVKLRMTAWASNGGAKDDSEAKETPQPPSEVK